MFLLQVIKPNSKRFMNEWKEGRKEGERKRKKEGRKVGQEGNGLGQWDPWTPARPEGHDSLFSAFLGSTDFYGAFVFNTALVMC
jgi:hypothetical protein